MMAMDNSFIIIRMKKVVSLITQARELTSQGPLDYYLKKLVEHSEALLTRFSPIKAGEMARIVRKVPCDGGWQHAKKTLAIGNVGTVEEVDYRGGSFVFTFVPCIQWRQNTDGTYEQCNVLHSYNLSEKYLERYELLDKQEEQEG